MKYAVTLACLINLSSPLCSKADETLDLIIVAGQSNAVGYDANPVELPADAADKNILFWWRCGDPLPDEYDSTSGDQWTTLKIQPKGNPRLPAQDRDYGNFRNADGGFGPEMQLARTLYAKKGERLAIVKVAFSGTSMAGDWNHLDPGNGGACYRSLVTETKAAIVAAKAQHITLHLTTLLWVQGESDASETAAPLYEKALGEMVTELRKEFHAPSMNVLLGVNTQFGKGSNRFLPQIVAAQEALAKKDPHCAYVDTSKAEVINYEHFGAAGMLEVGKLFAETLLKMDSKTSAKP
jgi:Carbohydrate esterase, sialic acid-specific acetylesterase